MAKKANRAMAGTMDAAKGNVATGAAFSKSTIPVQGAFRRPRTLWSWPMVLSRKAVRAKAVRS